MLRAYTAADQDTVIKIWLDASLQAHSFVDEKFWKSKEEEMRTVYLPQSEVWVYDSDLTGEVLGFVALKENYIAALFVTPEEQGNGVGYQLMEKVKMKHPVVELKVYKENKPSVKFYERQGFEVVGEGVEAETGHAELTMRFRRLA